MRMDDEGGTIAYGHGVFVEEDHGGCACVSLLVVSLLASRLSRSAVPRSTRRVDVTVLTI